MALLKQFDGAFAADFEQYAFVRTRHVGVACLRGRKVRVGVGVGLGHVQIGHASSVAQLLDRQVDVVLRQRAQLGFGFGVVEIDLGRADDRQVGVREVVTVGTEIGGRDELDGLVARHAGRKARHFDLGGVDARVTRRADRLRQTRIAVLALVPELHRFPARLVREARAVGHQIAGDDLARQARTPVGGVQRVEGAVVEYA